MKILGIESSCDETAASVVENGTAVLSDVISSSKDLHEVTGGIVPEVAARKQLEYVVPVISQALAKASLKPAELDAVAVTIGPGLIGSLLVGVAAAKTLALAWEKPLVPVNHLVGHIYANFVNYSADIKFPAVVLLVSGGHTDLVLMKDHGFFDYIGGTLDDAAGEAFDKTARLLGLAKYLGGVKLSQTAALCVDNKLKNTLPRPMLREAGFDFSFSGLKTAVKRLVEKNTGTAEEVARDFEDAVVDVLVRKTVKAAQEYKAVSVLMAGGVSANETLRERMKETVQKIGADFFVPEPKLCTDNAVCIASAAHFNYKPVLLKNVIADPSLGIMD